MINLLLWKIELYSLIWSEGIDAYGMFVMIQKS